MSCTLRRGLSFCLVDNHPVFMDIRADRYFELPPSVEAAFLAFLQGDLSERSRALLLRAGVVNSGDWASQRPVPASSTPCRASVMELPATHAPFKFQLALEIFGLVRCTARKLRTKPLHAIIDELVSERRATARPESCSAQSASHSALVEAAASFLRIRIYAPADTSCLLDSIALCRLLQRYRLPWTIVFGVTRYPFAAHCWVQVGDLVLNDTVGNALAHTTIRVA